MWRRKNGNDSGLKYLAIEWLLGSVVSGTIVQQCAGAPSASQCAVIEESILCDTCDMLYFLHYHCCSRFFFIPRRYLILHKSLVIPFGNYVRCYRLR